MPAPGVEPARARPARETVGDDSSVTLTAGGPALQKSLLPQTTPMTAAPPATATSTTRHRRRARSARATGSASRSAYSSPSDVATRNPTSSDFLPPNLTYEPGSATATTANNTHFTVDDVERQPALPPR